MYEPADDAPTIKRTQKRMNPSCFVAMVKELRTASAGASVQRLAEVSGLAEWTIRNYCKAFVIAGEAHICRWTKDGKGRDTTAYYRLGWGVNMPREKKTGSIRQKERRAKIRKQALAINLSSQD